MTKFDLIQGSLKAQKALRQKNSKAIVSAKAETTYGYATPAKKRLQVIKNVALALTVGASGLFLQSCTTVSTPMTMNNMVTRHGVTTTSHNYNASGKLIRTTTQYSEYDAKDMARIQREHARIERERARTFKEWGNGFKAWGKGIEALRESTR